MPFMHTQLVYEGDDNPKLKKVGLAIMGVGALVLITMFGAKNIGAMLGSLMFGFITLMVGALVFRIGATRRTVPCPHCRVGIAPSANVCPQCHLAVKGPGILARALPPVPATTGVSNRPSTAYTEQVYAAPAAFCPSCGGGLTGGAVFCGACGKRVSGS
jgi:Double zinc ribbon